MSSFNMLKDGSTLLTSFQKINDHPNLWSGGGRVRLPPEGAGSLGLLDAALPRILVLYPSCWLQDRPHY